MHALKNVYKLSIPILASRRFKGTICQIIYWWVGERDSNPAISNIKPGCDWLISDCVKTTNPCSLPRNKHRKQTRKYLTPRVDLDGHWSNSPNPCLSNTCKANKCPLKTLIWSISEIMLFLLRTLSLATKYNTMKQNNHWPPPRTVPFDNSRTTVH